LVFWHPNGQLQSVSVYMRGKTVSLETWDTAGYTPVQRAQLDTEEAARTAARRRADSLGVAQTSRNAALALWVPRVRATVETYWKLPEAQKKVPRRAVARLHVSPYGSLLDVTWLEKSGSVEFDRRAALALAKIRKFPAPPAELGTDSLNLRYEFVTPGFGAARKRLQVRDGGGDE
jgi:TonB family protein